MLNAALADGIHARCGFLNGAEKLLRHQEGCHSATTVTTLIVHIGHHLLVHRMAICVAGLPALYKQYDSIYFASQ